MSCVITFPKLSIDGGQYSTNVLYQFRTHDIYGYGHMTFMDISLVNLT